MTFAYPPSEITRWAPRARRQLSSLAPAALACVLATSALLLGWRGVDQAAQTYRVIQFQLHGMMLWDSGWYAGNLPLGYSILFPAVAALLGLQVMAVVSAVVATWSFDRVVRTALGARPLGTWYFAVSTLLPVTIGQWPFMAGEAAGLLAVMCLQKGRRPAGLALGVLAALFSPLAAAFLAMVCLAWAAYNSTRRRWIVATAAGCLAVIGIIALLFPGTGPEPFPWTGLVPTELLCLAVLTPLVQTTPAVRMGALLYAVSTLLSYVVANPLGGNAPRLAEWVGIPLLACFLTAPGPALARLSQSGLARRLSRGRQLLLPGRWRYLTALLVVPFAVWQWAPWNGIITSSTPAGFTHKAFYTPLVTELHRLAPEPVRAEVVPTADHWESAYVAPHVALARGWERQLDIADNPIFYTAGLLTPASYRSWLDQNGISYVALPAAPLDYAAKAEGALLRSQRIPGLRLVWTDRDWKLWKVTSSPGLVSGPGTLQTLAPDHLTLVARAPGQLTVRVTWTRFWSVSSGAACVAPAPAPTPAGPQDRSAHQWTSVTALRSGTISLTASVLPTPPNASCPTS